MGKTPELNSIDNAENFLRNGGLDFWQRFGLAKTFVSNGYIMDRWFSGATGAVLYERLSTSPPKGIVNYARITYPTASNNINDFYYLEDRDVNRIKGKTVTFSMMVRKGAALNNGWALRVFKNATPNTRLGGSWTQIASVTLLDSQIGDFTGSEDDWTEMKVTFDVPNDGSANGLRMNFVNTVNPAAGFVEIAGLMLNVGNERLPFRHFGGSLDADKIACKRYFEKSYSIDTATGFPTTLGRWQGPAFQVSGTSLDPVSVDFEVEKRAAPLINVWNAAGNIGNILWIGVGSSNSNFSSIAVPEFNTKNFALQCPSGIFTGARGNANHLAFHWAAEADF